MMKSLILGVFACFIGCLSPVFADTTTTYTYTGADYISISGPVHILPRPYHAGRLQKPVPEHFRATPDGDLDL
jgi:hypothetical protein